ncbi:MAG: carotenoid 1,2-hydratase [Candidatus Eremiobacteraeota bacterium]|nr:carotenoid 1,2-hydratase [Candidatus Eremiobacteraeota bacterium]MBC5801957.1 carotenoid 1,2-hydratase [Candidatus Eremiobacteraeota bacterium]MBC5821877.1 carotenoid 1,2-hydratase [Candidatus Eremiobacteraeota bacterium]
MTIRNRRAALVCAIAALGCAVAIEGASGTARDVAARTTASHSTFDMARAPYSFEFPRDHAAHPNYRSEWWYYTGHVRTNAGRRFGYELTFFRIGMHPGDPRPLAGQSRWRGNELYPAHFAITDERGLTFFYVDRFAREALGMGHASATNLDVKANRWTLVGTPLRGRDRERMRLRAAAVTANGTDGVDLVQVPEKPPAIHGHGGVSRKAACEGCTSHYYSYTRLRTTGTLEFGGVRFPVSGISWMDHEFGSGQLGPDQAGWDWVSVQLDDGRDLMLYRLRQKDGSVTPASSGSLVSAAGTVRYLPLRAFTMEAQGSWRSPHTNAVYPSGWRVRVPSARLDLVLEPTVLDQELAGTTGGISYWEGAVTVHDAAHGAERGVGYVELTGYAGPVSL